MIETSIDIEERNLGFKSNYGFTKPILFYIVNKNYNAAVKFALIDFQNGRVKYLTTLTDDYIRKLYEFDIRSSVLLNTLKKTPWWKCPKDTPFKLSQPQFPHSSLCFDPDEGFYNLMTVKPDSPLSSFRYIDLKNNKMNTYFGEDIGFKNTRFNETSTTSDPNYFVLSLDGQEDGVTYHIKCSKDLKEIELIGKTEDTWVSPHETYWHDGKVFTTEFFVKRYNIGGKILRNDAELEAYFGELPSYDLVLEMHKKGMFGHGELKQSHPDGEITYKTGLVPAHIEHDQDCFYVSSHNIVLQFEKMFFLEPASMIKYRYNGDRLEKEGEFKYEAGYRYTSHKLVNIMGNTKLITIGHPNRIVIANCNTMKLEKYIDVGETILDRDDLGRYLSLEYTQSAHDPLRISTLEVNPSGTHVTFLQGKDIHVVSLLTNEHVSVPFFIDDEDYFQRTYHSETLPTVRQ